MKPFRFIQPTDVIFGAGRLVEIGALTAKYGKRPLVVVDPSLPRVLPKALDTVTKSLKDAGLEPKIYQGVTPNPTLTDVTKGAEAGREHSADVVIGFGGGSAMDTARAITVAATHKGTAMDYLYFSKTQPTEKTLPLVLITTTSGTGSHVTCCAVITDEAGQFKSALWNRDRLFAKAAIVDPELMLTLPDQITAGAGFDVFTHAFESYINVNASPYGDLLAVESIRILVEYLPKTLRNGKDLEARSKMAWADTLAGMCISNVGTTLPHAMGQPISGHFPKVSHGRSLAVIYPAFLEYTWKSSVEKFARIARIFNPELASENERTAAEALRSEVIKFQKLIGTACTLDDFGIKKQDIDPILKHCMEFPDVQVNPIVPDTETVRSLYLKSFR